MTVGAWPGGPRSTGEPAWRVGAHVGPTSLPPRTWARRMSPVEVDTTTTGMPILSVTRQEPNRQENLMPATATPSQEDAVAQAALRATSTADLLRNAYALTHRIHEAEDALRGSNAEALRAIQRGPRVADLRAQRDLINAEVIRRAGA